MQGRPVEKAYTQLDQPVRGSGREGETLHWQPAALGVIIRKVNSSPPLRNDLRHRSHHRELWRYGARLAVFFTGVCQGLAGRCIRGESRPGLSSGVMADQMRLALASVPQTSYLHQSNWIKAANKTLYLYDWEGATVLKTLTRAIVASWIGLFVFAQLCACRVLSCCAPLSRF